MPSKSYVIFFHDTCRAKNKTCSTSDAEMGFVFFHRSASGYIVLTFLNIFFFTSKLSLNDHDVRFSDSRAKKKLGKQKTAVAENNRNEMLLNENQNIFFQFLRWKFSDKIFFFFNSHFQHRRVFPLFLKNKLWLSVFFPAAAAAAAADPVPLF